MIWNSSGKITLFQCRGPAGEGKMEAGIANYEGLEGYKEKYVSGISHWRKKIQSRDLKESGMQGR
jgi:hypothetical protein